MKSYISCGVVFLSFVFFHVLGQRTVEHVFENVVTAIEMSQVETVKKFLESTTLDLKGKEKLLNIATIILIKRGQRIELLQSPWDLAKFTSGIVLTLTGSFLGIIFAAVAIKEGPEALVPASLRTSLIELLMPSSLGAGIYLLKKGWSCSTAVELYENAEKIQKLLEAAPAG